MVKLSLKLLHIGVTGTPGSGKSYFARTFAKKLNAKLIEINDVAAKENLFIGKDIDGTRIVDIPRLKMVLGNIMKKHNRIILVGHLLTELNLKLDYVVVIRIKLDVLKQRLTKRGYHIDKIRDNIIIEAMDYYTTSLLEQKVKVVEVETKTDSIRFIKDAKRGSVEFTQLDKIGDLQEFFLFIEKNKGMGF